MKKIIFSLMAALLLTSCYEDKGNYDYTLDSMNNINVDSITFTPKSYESLTGTVIEIQQPMTDTLVQRIGVVLKQSIDTTYANLGFQWARNFTDKDSLGFTVIVKDTITTSGYVDLTFNPNEARTYDIRLIITDKKTTLKYYKSLTVKTRPVYKNSLFVLHGESGNRKLGNVELIGNIPNVTTDAWLNVNPTSADEPFKNAYFLDYSTNIDRNGSDRFFRTLCVFHEDGSANVWEPYGLSQKYKALSNTYVFLKKWGDIIPKRLVALGNPVQMVDGRMLIDRNGKYYVSGSYFTFIPFDNKMPKDQQKFHQSNFTVGTGTIMGNYYVFWDTQNDRFLYQSKPQHINGFNGESKGRTAANAIEMTAVLDAKVDFSALSADASPVGKRPVYAYVASMGNDYVSAQPFFIFSNTPEGEENAEETYYLYELKPLFGGKDFAGSTKRLGASVKSEEGEIDDGPKFSITARKLPALQPGTYASSVTYSYAYSTNYVFFIDKSGKTLFRYNTSNNELYTVYEAPDDYSITMFKFRSSLASDHNIELGRYISIALWNGRNGAVSELRLDNTGDIDPTFPVGLYDGTENEKFGRIHDMQYVHNFIND